MEPTLLPPRESLLGEPRKTASLLFMSIGAQAQFSFDIRGAESRSLKENEAWPQNAEADEWSSEEHSTEASEGVRGGSSGPLRRKHWHCRQPKFTQPGQQSHQQLSPGQQSQSAVASAGMPASSEDHSKCAGLPR